MSNDTSIDYSRYLVHSHLEIAFVLRALAESGELVTAYYNEGRDFMLTSVVDVDVDDGFVLLDPSADARANERLAHAGRVIFVSSHERVRVQWVADQVALVGHGSGTALRAAFPPSLMKLQRREYYRLTLPVMNALKCMLQSPDGARAELALADISVGGISLVGLPRPFALDAGAVFRNSRITLPDVGVVMADLELRYTAEIELRNGQKSIRAGFQFVNLPMPMQTLIQRYILKLDRERRSRFKD